MKLINVLFPVVPPAHGTAVDFYREFSQSEISMDYNKSPFHITQVGDFVIVSSKLSDEEMAIEKQINIIYAVDDLDAYWVWVQDKNQSVLISPQQVPTGRRFVIQQLDGKISEFLQLN